MELISSYPSSDESLSDTEIPPSTKKIKHGDPPNTQHISYNPRSKGEISPHTLCNHSDVNHVTETEVATGAYISKRKPRKHSINNTMESTFKSPKLNMYLMLTSDEKPPCVTRKNRVCTRISSKWRGHNKPIESLQWHPIHPHLLLSGGFDGLCKIWDVSENNDHSKCLCLHTAHSEQAVSVAKWLSPSTVISAGYDNRVVITDYIAMAKTATFVHDGHVTALKPHPLDHNLFVSGDASKNVQLWDVRTETVVKRYLGGGGRILDVEFINNGTEIVASCDVVRKNAGSKMLLVWEVNTAIIRSHQIYDEPYTCPCLKNSPFNNTFLAQSNANYIIIFNTCKPYKMNKYKRFEGHIVDGYKTQFDISLDGTLLCTGSADGKIHFFNNYSTKPIKTITTGISSPPIAVTWHPSLISKLACSLWDGTILVVE